MVLNFSEEILAYIMSRVKTTKDHTRRFSLYLSAQLMFGTVKVYYQQNMHLLGKPAYSQQDLSKLSYIIYI